MTWLIARLKEPSTWRGLIWLATAFGITFRPEVWEQITAVGMAVAGLIGVLTSEKPTTVDIRLPPIDLIATPESIARQLPVQPDYSPKEPAKFVDQQSGWNN